MAIAVLWCYGVMVVTKVLEKRTEGKQLTITTRQGKEKEDNPVLTKISYDLNSFETTLEILVFFIFYFRKPNASNFFKGNKAL